MRAASSLSLTVGMLAAVLALVSPPRATAADDLPRAAPESLGLDPAALKALDEDLKNGAVPLTDSLVIMRCGSVAFERTYTHDYGRIYQKEAHEVGPLNPHLTGPYNYFDPDWHPYWHGSSTHSMQSVTKSVTSATIGAAILRGDFKASLDTPVLHWFDAGTVKNVDARKQRMTLRHLLTMTAGIDWDEDVPYADPKNSCSLMEASNDWIGFVINRPMATEPGSKFVYSSGVSAVLGYIFRRETGRDVEDYARTFLFEPLGIHEYHWKRSPAGEVDTEGGLFLSATDLARFGELYRNLGVWRGQRLLSEEWVRDSVTPRSTPGEGMRYGYQWWLPAYDHGARRAWAGFGFGGQDVFVMPEDGLVAVTTAWSILDPKFYDEVVLEKLRTIVRPYSCPAGH